MRFMELLKKLLKKNPEFNIHIPLDADFIKKHKELIKIYGERFESLNGLHNVNLNFSSFIDNFTQDNSAVSDVTIDPNANSSTKDIRTLMSDIHKPHTKLLAANKIYYEIKKKYGKDLANSWLEGEWNGQSYLHDFPSSSFLPYCYSYDLDEVAERGLFFIDKFKPSAPKHLTTFNDHVLEFVSWTSNRTSGACGLASYLVYSYYFWKKDVEDGFYLRNPEYYRRQCFQKFIYDLNQPYLRITECAFTNITIMDRPYLLSLFGGRQFPDGSYIIEFIEDIIEHQKAFMETASEIRSEMMFTFPVLTVSLLFQDGKFVDEESARWYNRHNMKWSDANFYVGNDVTSLSSCCRLVNDFSKLDGFINSIGGTSLKIGSVKVNTINLRRIAIESLNNSRNVQEAENLYIEILKTRVHQTIKVLDVVRGIIIRNIEKGLLPNYSNNVIEIKRQFNTVGINAMYEAIRDFNYIDVDEFGNYSYSDDGVRFAAKILDTINEVKDSYKFDYSINIEAIPGERCASILCKKDSALYPSNNVGDFLYSNQWIPLVEKCTVQEKIRLGSLFDKKVGGGQIMHITLDGPFTNEEQAWDLLNYVASQGVLYFAMNLKIPVCEHGHAFFEKQCPMCGELPTDYFERIVGYLVPWSSYSKDRKIEVADRYRFDLSDSIF